MFNYIAIHAHLLYNICMYNDLSFKRLFFSHHVTEHVSVDSFSSHQHSDYEILLIINGEGVFVVENEAYNYKNNTIFLVPPTKYHVLQVPPQHRYERFVINFPQEHFPECARTDQCLHKIVDDKIVNLFYKLDEYADSFSHEQMHVLLLSALSEILILLTHDSDHKNAEKVKLPSVVKQAVDFIGNNIEKPLSLEYVAEHVFVSKSYLSHIFSKTMNVSIARYIRIKKMYAARNFLQQKYPATYISQLLGYENYSTFLRCYRAEFGKTPSCDAE